MGTTDALTIWQALQALGLGGGLLVVVLVLYRGLLVTKAHNEATVAAEREKTDLLRAELGKREELYRQSLTELREDGTRVRGERDRVAQQLDEHNRQMYRFADVLGELRDAIRDRAPR